jgi:hypothetical protein
MCFVSKRATQADYMLCQSVSVLTNLVYSVHFNRSVGCPIAQLLESHNVAAGPITICLMLRIHICTSTCELILAAAYMQTYVLLHVHTPRVTVSSDALY